MFQKVVFITQRYLSSSVILFVLHMCDAAGARANHFFRNEVTTPETHGGINLPHNETRAVLENISHYGGGHQSVSGGMNQCNLFFRVEGDFVRNKKWTDCQSHLCCGMVPNCSYAFSATEISTACVPGHDCPPSWRESPHLNRLIRCWIVVAKSMPSRRVQTHVG